ncbi:15168_t:CDS:2 [Cetraspora pellucida]|uniref:15168_t:CDS:1 n=1 Tax=Cetraspora pellucida TaxID=1433469 RepID=A0ACA9KB25_9GLOM|nr:15168_t:CDS:2 [Cetraspora pellucida]
MHIIVMFMMILLLPNTKLAEMGVIVIKPKQIAKRQDTACQFLYSSDSEDKCNLKMINASIIYTNSNFLEITYILY